MMNTLQTSLLENEISSSISIKEIIASLNNNLNLEKFPTEIHGFQGSISGFFLAEYVKTYKKDIFVVLPSEKEVLDIQTDIESTSFSGEVLVLPWWGTVPYRSVAKGSVIFGQRSSVLAKMAFPSENSRIFLIPQRSFMTPVPSPEYSKSNVFSVKVGEDFDPVKLSETLIKNGYIRVPRVTVRGEFALRGEVLDVFMPGEELAHRIVFDFDTIEQIKSFDPESQSSKSNLKSLVIYPMKEVIWNDELVANLVKKAEPFCNPVVGQDEKGAIPVKNPEAFREKFENFTTELLVNHEAEGEELFYPLVFEKKYSVLDYIKNDSVLFYVDYDRLQNAQESFEREYLALYRSARLERAVPSPQTILFNFEQLVATYNTSVFFKTIHSSEVKSVQNLSLDCDPPHSYFGNINYLKETIGNLIAENWKIFIYAESENQALRVNELLLEFQDKIHIVPLSISAGFGLPERKVLVIQENEIFGRRKHVPRSVKHAKSAVIDTFVELNPGDYVVHVNYGIGKFQGIERVKALGNERDYIKLLYAEDETVFIPIEQVNLVQRYIGNEGDAPRLDRIGSKSWENRKNKVKKSVEELAERLIALYSKRKAARGFPFPKDGEWQTAFEAAFPYTETDDQITVSKEIKEDMEKPVPMDRLVCGDVGYGKTEMAMRAAFKAVMGGKQVAFLAPTTLLAEQHYESCIIRFENFHDLCHQKSKKRFWKKWLLVKLIF